MSFIITLHVKEGIVMASDSRLTYTQTTKQEEGDPLFQLGVGISDSNYKTFVTPNNIGISAAGQAFIQGTPISGYVETFIQNELGKKEDNVENIAQKLINYFQQFQTPPKTIFHVAGYQMKENTNEKDKQIWQISPSKNKLERINKHKDSGIIWGGEGDILARIIHPVGLHKGMDKYDPLPYHRIPFEYFTLQDAIDFSIYAIRTTIDSMRFLPRAKTVGGPIDVLVIKPDQSTWVQRKKLHGENHLR